MWCFRDQLFLSGRSAVAEFGGCLPSIVRLAADEGGWREQRELPMRKRYIAVGAVAILVSILVLVVWFEPRVLYYVWGYRTQDIDVRSGRIRVRKYGFGLLVSERVVETEFSRWAEELSLVESPPSWKRGDAATAGLARLGRYRISFRYGGAIADCRNLILCEEIQGADRARRTEDIAQFLRLMQSGDLHEMQRIIVERGKAQDRDP